MGVREPWGMLEHHYSHRYGHHVSDVRVPSAECRVHDQPLLVIVNCASGAMMVVVVVVVVLTVLCRTHNAVYQTCRRLRRREDQRRQTPPIGLLFSAQASRSPCSDTCTPAGTTSPTKYVLHPTHTPPNEQMLGLFFGGGDMLVCTHIACMADVCK